MISDINKSRLAHQGSSRPLVKTMLLAVSMRLPPHATVAHIGRGVTPHCCWQPSMEPFRSNGCPVAPPMVNCG